MESLASGKGARAPESNKMASPKEKIREKAAGESMGNPLVWLLKKAASIFLLLVLPFMLLIRLSLYLNVEQGMNVWVSLIAGMGATALILVLYAGVLRQKLMGTWKVSGRMSKMMIAVVLLYCGYSLMYLSGTNVKSEGVRDTYLSLHPILRVATSTLVLADRSLVVTDMARTPDDYVRMGLPVLENSLHYRQQSSGFVEAVDLRTQGRSEVVNQLVRFYYWGMGFNTLRHTGTADHLHISMPQ